ncbi:MAG: hypothetical protein IJ088_16360 [Clostridia bacterium]|nr:hypothetical protein [Clostridia bacterium]
MMTEKKSHWYVVRTLAGREELVVFLLNRLIERPDNADIFVEELMIPTRRVKLLRNGKVVEKNRKLFPGYVFVKMVRTTQTWYSVRFTYGVTGFVGINKRPTAISEAEVDQIMKVQLPEKIDLRVGDRVKFRWALEYALLGFPEGIEMTIEKVSDDERILAVSFMLANRKNMIQCDYDFCQVQKIEEMEAVQESAPGEHVDLAVSGKADSQVRENDLIQAGDDGVAAGSANKA